MCLISLWAVLKLLREVSHVLIYNINDFSIQINLLCVEINDLMFNPFFRIKGKFSFHFFLNNCLFLCFQVRLLKGCSILYWVNFCLILDWQEVLNFMLKRNWPAMYRGSTEISVFYMKSKCQNLFSSWCRNCVSKSAFF